VAFAEGATERAPFVASVPLQPPLPEQAVALVELQVRIEDRPAVIDVGLAVRVTVGIGV
jgi:hypothetical protein